ncbi:OmpH family outer membrane protein [Sneathiella sp.]|uniref:OmpH family outer membrane protein n=1 Tax=Sneathiella sp. TaxID=1964365 RepID=UPI0039E30D5B
MNFFNMFNKLGFAILLGLFCVTSVAHAQDAQNIAVLDLGAVLSKSKAMKDADMKISAMEKNFKAKNEIAQNKLREEEQQIAQQRAILAPDVFVKKRDAFRKKAADFNRNARLKLRQFALTRSDTVKKIEKTMEPIVSKIAKSVGATMIVEKKQILFGETKLEITDLVVADLNAKLPSVSVKLVPLPAQ